jgi:hypothetical protein
MGQVNPLSVVLASILVSFLSPQTKDIESAFLQNRADGLHRLFTSSGSLHLSLPEPLGFSDRVSDEQARLLFERFFSSFRTVEFYLDPRPSVLPGDPARIHKSRWSFRNIRTNTAYVFDVFIRIQPEFPPPGAERRARPLWRIAEIRADKR